MLSRVPGAFLPLLYRHCLIRAFVYPEHSVLAVSACFPTYGIECLCLVVGRERR